MYIVASFFLLINMSPRSVPCTFDSCSYTLHVWSCIKATFCLSHLQSAQQEARVQEEREGECGGAWPFTSFVSGCKCSTQSCRRGSVVYLQLPKGLVDRELEWPISSCRCPLCMFYTPVEVSVSLSYLIVMLWAERGRIVQVMHPGSFHLDAHEATGGSRV